MYAYGSYQQNGHFTNNVQLKEQITYDDYTCRTLTLLFCPLFHTQSVVVCTGEKTEMLFTVVLYSPSHGSSVSNIVYLWVGYKDRAKPSAEGGKGNIKAQTPRPHAVEGRQERASPAGKQVSGEDFVWIFSLSLPDRSLSLGRRPLPIQIDTWDLSVNYTIAAI